VHDYDGFRRLAGRIVDGGEIGKRRLGDDAEAGSEAEGVFQPARDDGVGNADVDHVRQLIACRGLRGGKTDVAGIAADDAGDAGRVHLLHLGDAAVRRRLRIAKHSVDLAQSLDAAGGIDFFDRHGGAEPALLAGVRQGAGDRMQHAEFHPGALRAHPGRHGGGRRAQRRGGEERAAAEWNLTVGHVTLPRG